MRRVLVGLAAGFAVMTASLSVAALQLRAEEKPPKGPDEDGTKPALVRIAGEGLLNSHAFGFLTELSDERVTAVLAGPCVGEEVCGDLAQAERVVEFAKGEQSGVGCDL